MWIAGSVSNYGLRTGVEAGKERLLGDGQQQAGAVAGAGVGGDRAAVAQALEAAEGGVKDGPARTAVHVGHEADAAGVALVAAPVVQGPAASGAWRQVVGHLASVGRRDRERVAPLLRVRFVVLVRRRVDEGSQRRVQQPGVESRFAAERFAKRLQRLHGGINKLIRAVHQIGREVASSVVSRHRQIGERRQVRGFERLARACQEFELREAGDQRHK